MAVGETPGRGRRDRGGGSPDGIDAMGDHTPPVSVERAAAFASQLRLAVRRRRFGGTAAVVGWQQGNDRGNGRPWQLQFNAGGRIAVTTAEKGREQHKGYGQKGGRFHGQVGGWEVTKRPNYLVFDFRLDKVVTLIVW